MPSALRPIAVVAEELGIPAEHVVPYGRDKAKIDLAALAGAPRRAGRLVLVSAIEPAGGGEGKTTISVALAMALRRLGRRTALCLREPSLGPVFGIKGGGTGGGAAQVEPAADINLHFTGDLHAVTAAHNLLAALVDGELHFGGTTGLDPRRIHFPRVLDVNDRALRHVLVGLGGPGHGMPREARFVITAASEVMACLCLAESIDDLRVRLGRIVVGERKDGSFVRASDVGGVDAMLALLRDALSPNLVQTREGGPALVHGGPFANVAHGCSSVVATRLGLAYADDVVTEAGFGFDLGGEKFLHLKCRGAGLFPRVVVLVCTARAFTAHGGGSFERGLHHLDRQIANVGRFGLPCVVAINVFDGDSESELSAIEARARSHGVRVERCTGFRHGSEGAIELGRTVADVLAGTDAHPPAPRFLYPLEASLETKIRTVVTAIDGASDVAFTERAKARLAQLEANGAGTLPVCIAKTPLSFSDDPRAGGLAEGFVPTVTGLELSAGAGFVVARMGEIELLPGLPRKPAALRVRVDDDGTIHGLMQGEGGAEPRGPTR